MGSLDIALFLISVILFFGSTVLTKDDIMHTDMIISLVVSLPILAVAYIFVPKNKYKGAYILLVFLAGLIRMALVSYLYSNGTDTFGTDGLLYHQEGIMVARQLDEGLPFYSVEYSYTWYTVFVGLIYHFFGVDRYIVSYVNIALAFFSAILILKMALNHKYKYANAAFISLAFLYFPNLSLWTADSRKESLLIFVCCLCWYCVQRFTNDITEKKGGIMLNICRLVLVCLLMWLSTLIRIYMFIPLAAGIILSQLLLYKKSLTRMSVAFAAAVSISAGIIFFATMNPLTNGYHAISFSSEPSFSTTQEVSSKLQTVKTIASNRNIAASIVDYIILPLPGKIDIADLHGDRKLEFIVSMDMLAWYGCLFLMASGIYSTFRKRESCFIGLIAFMASYILINAIVVENVSDTIYRYRSVIVGTALLMIDGDVVKYLFDRIEEPFGLKSINSSQSIINGFGIKQ